MSDLNIAATVEAKRKRKPARAFGYCWKLEDGSLCHWATPELKRLIEGGHPSPGAKAVRVELIEVDHRGKPKSA